LVWYHQFVDKKESWGGHGFKVVLFVGLLSSFVFVVYSQEWKMEEKRKGKAMTFIRFWG
jgi:hypothetical protein